MSMSIDDRIRSALSELSLAVSEKVKIRDSSKAPELDFDVNWGSENADYMREWLTAKISLKISHRVVDDYRPA